MPGAYKREGGSKYTIWWVGEDGKKHFGTGTVDKKTSQAIAAKRESDARLVREGLQDPAERRQREARFKPVEDHIADYRAALASKGDTPRHARHISGTLRRLLADASIESIADMPSDRLQASIARMMVRGKDKDGAFRERIKPASSRTKDHALRALRAFTTWLHDSGRIKDQPRGLKKIQFKNESNDRRRRRRALTVDEMRRLIDAAQRGEPIVTRRPSRGRKPSEHMTGPERAICYRIAMATGFRATEIRTLFPERFQLEGDSPSITVLACYSKRGKRSGRDDTQPIGKDVADILRPWLATRPAGKPVLAVPERTAQMLRIDLAAAGIPYVDDSGRVLDFHALRYSYVTSLINSGANPKVVQNLARHSSITLTLDLYATVEEGDARKALEGKSAWEAASGPRRPYDDSDLPGTRT